MRYLDRFIDRELEKWSKSPSHKPLLLRGARQVGKTSAVRHLGEKFKYYVEIDLNDQRELHTPFLQKPRKNTNAIYSWILVCCRGCWS